MYFWTHYICLICCFLSAYSIMFNLEPNTQKCLKEELLGNIPVIGEIEVSEQPGQSVAYVVTDTKRNTLAQRSNVSKGKFSFNTEHPDTYEICFISQVAPNQRGVTQQISLITKHGIETKNYEALGEAANLKPIERDLQKLEDLSNSIVEDFAYMRKREEEMRNTNESTNYRVLVLSTFSLFCLLVLAVWQVLYLRRFFKAKKLIE